MGKGKAVKKTNNTSNGGEAKGGTNKRSDCEPKFKSNCANLEGCTFDCQDQWQANKFVALFKQIVECVGAEHYQGGDICSTLENKVDCFVLKPVKLIGPADHLDTCTFEKN